MAARNITVVSVALNEVKARQNGVGYEVEVEYNIIFNDGSGQSRRQERSVNSGSVKTALDTLFNDIKTRIGNAEGVNPP